MRGEDHANEDSARDRETFVTHGGRSVDDDWISDELVIGRSLWRVNFFCPKTFVVVTGRVKFASRSFSTMRFSRSSNSNSQIVGTKHNR